jgi:hypothetical protein
VRKLAEETCLTGLKFIENESGIDINGDAILGTVMKSESPSQSVEYEPNCIQLDTQSVQLPEEGKSGILRLNLRNLDNEPHSFELRFSSPKVEFIEEAFKKENVIPGEDWNLAVGFRSRSESGEHLSFSVEIWVDGILADKREMGVPGYGSWLLFGPFIQDDPSLEPMDQEYPDHGLSTLPSFRYMNQDQVNHGIDFLTTEKIRTFIESGMLMAQDFSVQQVFPIGFKWELNHYFRGRGERTLYLYTGLRPDSEREIWITAGCSSILKVWLNDEVVIRQEEPKRCWPYANYSKAFLKSGRNDLLIRIDLVSDQIEFEIGFKEFNGEHPHQSSWDQILIPEVPTQNY